MQTITLKISKINSTAITTRNFWPNWTRIQKTCFERKHFQAEHFSIQACFEREKMAISSRGTSFLLCISTRLTQWVVQTKKFVRPPSFHPLTLNHPPPPPQETFSRGLKLGIQLNQTKLNPNSKMKSQKISNILLKDIIIKWSTIASRLVLKKMAIYSRGASFVYAIVLGLPNGLFSLKSLFRASLKL